MTDNDIKMSLETILRTLIIWKQLPEVTVYRNSDESGNFYVVFKNKIASVEVQVADEQLTQRNILQDVAKMLWGSLQLKSKHIVETFVAEAVKIAFGDKEIIPYTVNDTSLDSYEIKINNNVTVCHLSEENDLTTIKIAEKMRDLSQLFLVGKPELQEKNNTQSIKYEVETYLGIRQLKVSGVEVIEVSKNNYQITLKDGSVSRSVVTRYESLEYMVYSLYKQLQEKKMTIEEIKTYLTEILKTMVGSCPIPEIDVCCDNGMPQIHVSMKNKLHIFGVFITNAELAQKNIIEDKILLMWSNLQSQSKMTVEKYVFQTVQKMLKDNPQKESRPYTVTANDNGSYNVKVDFDEYNVSFAFVENDLNEKGIMDRIQYNSSYFLRDKIKVPEQVTITQDVSDLVAIVKAIIYNTKVKNVVVKRNETEIHMEM